MTAHLTMALIASTVAMATPAPRRIDWLPRLTVSAVQYWGNGQLPACGPISYAWAKAADPEEKAHADLATCTVVFSTDYWPQFVAHPAWQCVLQLHEIGHLYGHAHEEGGVMSQSTDKYEHPELFAPCRGVPA